MKGKRGGDGDTPELSPWIQSGSNRYGGWRCERGQCTGPGTYGAVYLTLCNTFFCVVSSFIHVWDLCAHLCTSGTWDFCERQRLLIATAFIVKSRTVARTLSHPALAQTSFSGYFSSLLWVWHQWTWHMRTRSCLTHMLHSKVWSTNSVSIPVHEAHVLDLSELPTT